MIKAIVVDDERLVRKGFISLIDWPSFGITIVGEAPDGKGALALLEKEETDLIFTDITMPGMSGFDLIKQVRFRYPHIHSVVLTCHHEFDYAQEALRLGAIDYIVKTLLEMDNIDEVMRRIVERICYEGSSRRLPEAPRGGGETLPDCLLALVPADSRQPGPELPRLPLLQRQPLIGLDGGIQLVPLPRPIGLSELQQELGGTHAGSWLAALVTDAGGVSAGRMKELLAAQLPRLLFYTLPAPGAVAHISRQELEAASAHKSNASPVPEAAPRYSPGSFPFRLGADSGFQSQDDSAFPIFQVWSELKWALYDEDWIDFVRQIEQLKPEAGSLCSFARSLLFEWGTVLHNPQEAELLAADTAQLHLWSDWKVWFRRFADLLQRRMIALSLSKDVMFSLIRAVLYMRANAGEKINQADVAAHIHMSRSYFSQCFAKLAGLPFGEALRELRIELAKSLLLGSEVPVYEVAASAGFEDDKYFSRVFRERVGLLPTEFRAKGRKRFNEG